MPTLAKPRRGSVLKPQQRGVAPVATCRNCGATIKTIRAAGQLPAWRHLPSGARTCPPPDTDTPPMAHPAWAMAWLTPLTVDGHRWLHLDLADLFTAVPWPIWVLLFLLAGSVAGRIHLGGQHQAWDEYAAAEPTPLPLTVPPAAGHGEGVDRG